jgi:hypothetical protein
VPTRRARHAIRRRLSGIPLAVVAAGLVLTGAMGAIGSPPPAGAVTPPAQGWTTVQAPLPADAGTGSTDPDVYTASTTCPASNGCVTVGWYSDTSGKPWGLIETQSDTTWTDTEAPQPSDAGHGANQGFWFGSQSCGFDAPCRAVSCPTASFCVAVGQYMDSSGFLQPVVDTFANGAWTSQRGALPPDSATDTSVTQPDGYFYSVSCASTSSCAAVGQYTTTGGTRAAYIATLAGTSWSAAAAPLPADSTGGTSQLFGVSCTASGTCAATGQFTATAGDSGLLEALVNGTWTATDAPVPANAANPNFAVDIQVVCTTATSCVAVGDYAVLGAGGAPLVNTWNGSTWAGTEAPMPPDVIANDGGQLTAVSCASPTSCVGVGLYETGSPVRTAGLIDTLSGGTWAATRAPVPADAGTGSNLEGTLNEVACSTPTSCLTVGSYGSASGNETALVDSLGVGGWTSMPAPVPSNVTTTPAGLVSEGRTAGCYSDVACSVAGLYIDNTAGSNRQGFLDTYTGTQGYWMDASDGGIFNYGNAPFHGSAGSLHLNAPMVGMAPTPAAGGYWLVGTDGGIFNYGDAGFFGSRGGQPLNKPIVGMAATADGKGYWLVASDGGIFNYGDAGFFGSRGGQPLNKPIVGMAATADGQGYWLVASDGGIFNYGDAGFFGSTGSITLNKPVVGMAASPSGLGYWLVASDGGIFNYGDGQFFGSTGSLHLNKPVVGLAASPSGKGYWLAASDGGIFNYGDAPFYGSAGGLTLNKPVVGVAG